MDDWLGLAGVGGGILDSLLGSSAAHKANRMNLQIWRENRAWQENLANSAVTRKMQDVKNAGLNPVLAVTGPAAATPSVPQPTIQPEFDASKGGISRALVGLTTAAQLRNIEASTKKTEADARVANVEADLREELLPQEREQRANRLVESVEWDDIKTQLLRNQRTSSGAEAERLSRTVDAMVQRAKQDARAGQLDLEALENIARMGGIEGTKAAGLIKLLIDLYRAQKAPRD